MDFYAWLVSCWKWSIKLSYCCCCVLPPSVMWFPQPGALLLGRHQSVVALLPIQLICFALHSIILCHLRHIFSDYFVWRTFGHAVFCCSPCCGTLPSIISPQRSVQNYIRYSLSFDWWIPSLHVWTHHCLATMHSLFFLVFVLALSPGWVSSPSSLHTMCFLDALWPAWVHSHWHLSIFYRHFSDLKHLAVFKTNLKRIKWTSVGNRILLTLLSPLLGAPKATVIIISEEFSPSLGFSCVCSALESATSPLVSEFLIKVFWPIVGIQTKCLHLSFYEWLRVLKLSRHILIHNISKWNECKSKLTTVWSFCQLVVCLNKNYLKLWNYFFISCIPWINF